MIKPDLRTAIVSFASANETAFLIILAYVADKLKMINKNI